MRRDPSGQRRLAGPEPESAGDIGVGEAAAALGEEESLLAWLGRQRPAATLQVAAQGELGGLADRQDALLGTLAEHPQLLALEVHRGGVEVDDLLAAQPAGVGQLEHRAVAQLQRLSLI